MFILIGIPGENYRPVVSHWQPYHIMLYRLSEIRTHNVSILEIYAINNSIFGEKNDVHFSIIHGNNLSSNNSNCIWSLFWYAKSCV